MTSAKQKVKWAMDKRVQRMKAKKRKMGPRKIIADFINEMEALRSSVSNITEFDHGMDKIVRELDIGMRAIDPDVTMKIKWHDEVKVEDYQELRVEGVLVKWSKLYRGKHPLNDSELYIDVGQLFLEGYFD